MSRFWLGFLIWVAFWIGTFCVLEGLAAFWKGCPWPTFSWEAWQLQKKIPALTILFVFVLSILGSHLIRTKNVQEGD